MIHVTDTHRLPYRNAYIRAFKLSDGTTPLNFYNLTESNPNGLTIGNIVYTNERGYICYGQDKQLVECLALAESAVIEVSLDNGTSWLIKWILRTGANTLTADDIGKLYYWNYTGTKPASPNGVWDPLNGDATLPDYIPRNAVHLGYWEEDTIRVSGDTSDLTSAFNEWTSVVRFAPSYSNSNCFINGTRVRAGQKICFCNETSHTITINNNSLLALPAHSAELLIATGINANTGAATSTGFVRLSTAVISQTSTAPHLIIENAQYLLKNNSGGAIQIYNSDYSISKLLTAGNIALIADGDVTLLQKAEVFDRPYYTNYGDHDFNNGTDWNLGTIVPGILAFGTFTNVGDAIIECTVAQAGIYVVRPRGRVLTAYDPDGTALFTLPNDNTYTYTVMVTDNSGTFNYQVIARY